MQQFTDQRIVVYEVTNHAEFKQRLRRLNLTSDLQVLDDAVADAARSWFRLAREHEAELLKLNPADLPRAVYSRAYYAAYNASKAIRYVSRGAVSMRGDDHRKVSELPDSFPDVAKWTRNLQLLYEHRLRADYDNWTETPHEHSLKPAECADLAKEFLTEGEKFLTTNYKIRI